MADDHESISDSKAESKPAEEGPNDSTDTQRADRAGNGQTANHDADEIVSLLFEEQGETASRRAYDGFVRLVEDDSLFVNVVGMEVSKRLSEPNHRTEAVYHLTEMIPLAPGAFEQAIPTLADIATDETAPQQSNAARALYQFATTDPTLVADNIDSLAEIVEMGFPEPRKFAVHALEAVADEKPSLVVDAVPALVSFIESSASRTDMREFLANEKDTPGMEVGESEEHVVRNDELETADLRGTAASVVAHTATARPDLISITEEELRVLLTDDYPPVQTAGTRIAAVLVEDRPQTVAETLPAIIERLGPMDSDERRSLAVETLETLCDHNTPAVQKALADQTDLLTESIRSEPTIGAEIARVLRTVLDGNADRGVSEGDDLTEDEDADEVREIQDDSKPEENVDREPTTSDNGRDAAETLMRWIAGLLTDDDGTVRATAALGAGQLPVTADTVEVLANPRVDEDSAATTIESRAEPDEHDSGARDIVDSDEQSGN